MLSAAQNLNTAATASTLANNILGAPKIVIITVDAIRKIQNINDLIDVDILIFIGLSLNTLLTLANKAIIHIYKIFFIFLFGGKNEFN